MRPHAVASSPSPDPLPAEPPPPAASPTAEDTQPGAPAITRGVRRALAERGFVTLTEFRLPCGRRADVLGIDGRGDILIVEVKSGVTDFRTDQKWSEYREWCDTFYFAVDDAFPADLIPEDCGLMIADSYGAAVLRKPEATRIAPARRRTLIQRAALVAAGRLHRIEDPMFSSSTPNA